MSINAVLARNLVALSVWSVDQADAIARAPEVPHPVADDPDFAESVEWLPTYALVVIGFGSHVRAALRRANLPAALRRRYLFARKGERLWTYPTIVYEPELSRVRSVMSSVDMAAEIDGAPLVILSSTDPAELSAALFPYRESITMGAYIADGLPVEGRTEFVRALADYAASAHMDVFTNVALTEQVIVNAFANAERYAASAGITDLKDCAKGRPALSIAAGPSLSGSLEELARPGVRDRFVIIAAQTVLRLLLSRGIRPHFVTALDYHEASGRFYEGLTAADVRGVQLVARAQCSPVIPRSFPGPVRFYRDEVLDAILADGRDMGTLRAGASVAHLSYYLARYMGCDPVVLVGHDLGFADKGRTHADGAPGQVGKVIRETVDVHGRPMFTDAQMAAYLDQFQREFAADEAAGLATIDATGGGVRKLHTTVAALADVLDRPGEAVSVPDATAPLPVDPSKRVADVQRGMARVRELIVQAEGLLGQLRACRDDEGRARIVAALDAVQAEAVTIEPALSIVNYVEQAGSLRRIRENRRRWLERAPGLPTGAERSP